MITNNTASHNQDHGIYVSYSNDNVLDSNITLYNGDGIAISYSTNNKACNNSILINSIGIDFGTSNSNTLYKNKLSNNGNHIYLHASDNNRFYLNDFQDSWWVPTYSFDSTNVWNSAEKATYSYDSRMYTNYLGNYWSDYGGTDNNSDGIGDTPYSIDSDSDNYPLVEAFENYQIDTWVAGSPWPMFQHDAQHTGRSPYIGPQTDNVRWIYDFPGDPRYTYDSRVAIGPEDIIYIGRYDGIYSIEPNGTLQWLFELPYVTTICIGSDGTIYAVSRSGLSAIDQSGNELWQYALPFHSYEEESAVIFSDKLYLVACCVFPDDSMHLSLFSFYADGTVFWIYDSVEGVLYENPSFPAAPSGWQGSGSGLGTSPAIGPDGTIYVAGPQNTLHAFNPDGTVKWTRAFESILGSPSISTDETILLSEGLRLRAISPDGEDVWIYNNIPYSWSAWRLSPVIGLDGTTYWEVFYNAWGYTEPVLFALDDQGDLIWSVKVSQANGSWCNSVTLGADGIIYQLFWSLLTAFNQSGKEVWSYSLFAVYPFTWTCPALGSDGTLYIATSQRLYAFGPGDTTPPTISSVLPQNGATDVGVDIAITATFSEAMDSSTITASSFTLSGSTVSGTVTYDSDTYTATFTPNANLEYGHQYTVTLSTDIKDLAGNPLEGDYTWSFTTTPGEVVTFSDPNLEAAIREAINKPTGDIYQADLEGLTTLDASEKSIADLTGLEYCINLTELVLDNNQISDISSLTGLTNLQTLSLCQNQISNILPLAGLTNLQSLLLSLNQISDISSLTGLTNLQTLGLAWNQISNTLPLAGLIKLQSLHLSLNQISDISPLTGLTNLLQLSLADNRISGISALARMTNLRTLYLGDNQISDISSLTGLTNLQTLSLDWNQISDISSLAWLTKLSWLDLGDNQISNISPLASLTNLTVLRLHGNQINNLSPLAGLTNLQELHLGWSQISDISSLAWLTKLSWLNLFDNQISDISPLVANAGLSAGDEINLQGNPLSADSLTVCLPQLQSRGVTVLYDAVNITTTSLPDGEVGVAYSETLTATDGTGAYTWSLSDGPLPPGLSLNPDTGVISRYPHHRRHL